MSVRMKKPHIKANKPVLCVSEQGQVYRVPQTILNKYVTHDAISIKNAKNIDCSIKSISPEEAFAEINAKYSKTGALLKAVRLREGMSQKDFAALINVTQGDLSKMEQGKRPVGKLIVSRIAKKFKSRIA